ncbi:unnamed protein product [Enterobius vermicularis]|uniref:PAS domain-containing protein n=1 Tax=Enterobius vermicularis TaxID=51028 RepID=A0A3P6I935_ENTVE|nr:unnamed protein product [Enterobius vermicularis]
MKTIFVNISVSLRDKPPGSSCNSPPNYISTNQYSVSYNTARLPGTFLGLTIAATPQSLNSSSPSSLSPQPPVSSTLQNSLAPKRRLKAVFIIDSKTTEILVANDNVKRVFGLLHPSLIGRRFTDIFSTSPNQQLPAILYNTLVTPDGHLKEVYGKAIDAIDSQGKQCAISAWSYPLTQAAADASKGGLDGKKNSMLIRTLSAIIPRGRRNLDSGHGSPVAPPPPPPASLFPLPPPSRSSVTCISHVQKKIMNGGNENDDNDDDDDDDNDDDDDDDDAGNNIAAVLAVSVYKLWI